MKQLLATLAAVLMASAVKGAPIPPVSTDSVELQNAALRHLAYVNLALVCNLPNDSLNPNPWRWRRKKVIQHPSDKKEPRPI